MFTHVTYVHHATYVTYVTLTQGYFASWAGVACSVGLLLDAFPQMAATATAAATSTARHDEENDEVGASAPYDTNIISQPLHAGMAAVPPEQPTDQPIAV